MDFKNLKDSAYFAWNWFSNFRLSEFCFQFEFFVDFDFQMHRTHLKSFVFEIFSITF